MTSTDHQQADLIRETERRRIRALVRGDAGEARSFHADDFQLITPIGAVLTRDAYLGAIATGHITYRLWEPHDMAVRLSGSQAVIRYRADLEVTFNGYKAPPAISWHTDTYECRDGRWVVVWSQATIVA